MKMKKRLLSILLSLVLVLGLMPGISLTAYATNTPVTSVTLNKTTLSMVGDMNSTNENLVATVAPNNASNKTVVWENSDETVVYGSPNSNLGDGGYNNLYSLRPRKAGTATITVRATNGTEDFSDDQTAVCTVKVYDSYPIGTFWHSGDPINLHGAWFISQQNDSTYLQHSKDMDVALPSFTQNLTDTTIATPDFLPVSEHIWGSTVYPYEEGKKIPLYMIKPADKTSELPIGIKLVKGKGTSGSPYEFELVYKSNPSFTAPTAKTLTYSGQVQELVTAGTVTGGEMQYALGTETEATEDYTTSIPTATDVGTYYVWYKVMGDENHYDSSPACVTVTIAEKKQDTAPKKEEPKKPEEPNPPAETQKDASLRMNSAFKVYWKDSTIRVKWGSVLEADTFDIYASYCTNKKCKKIKTIHSSTTVTIKKLKGKKLDRKRSIKVYVVAYHRGVKIGRSFVGHAAGGKSKCTNARMIKLNKKSYKLTVGKTAKIKAKIVKVNDRKKLLSKSHCARLRYTSSNPAVAKVNSKGKIMAVGKGKCYVLVSAQNGRSKKVPIAVK